MTKSTPSALPVIALVGRPNTGKSTLFNRITRSQRAVVDEMPGVTRDRNIAFTSFGHRQFLLVDTGGFEDIEQEDMNQAVRNQSLLAAEEADAIIMVFDGRAGMNHLDSAVFDRVRRFKKPYFVAINKIDTPSVENLQAEFYALGADKLYPISAEHGREIGTLLDDVLAALPLADATEEADDATGVAIIGRPNVGKSSLLNRLVGFERSIVSPIPGTTRDPLDTIVEHDGKRYRLVDTAGIRRRPRVHEYVEKASVVRALRAVERASIALLVVDAVEGFTEQDARVSGYAWERGRGLGLIVNKWDAVDKKEHKKATFSAEVDHWYASLRCVPRLFLSAKTGSGVGQVWGMIRQISSAHKLQIQTAKLNQTIERAVQQQAPPIVKGKRPKFFYAAQTGTEPPSIAIFTAGSQHVPPTYQRYLEHQIRSLYPLEGTPLRIFFRPKRKEKEA